MSTKSFSLTNGNRVGIVALCILSIALGAFIVRWLPTRSTRVDSVGSESKDESKALGANAINQFEPIDIVKMPEDLWPSAGIVIATAEKRPRIHSVQLTGKVALNEDRVAHIYPMVEGTVHSVHVQLGQKVKADDLLVVIHSREVGQSKLELYQARLVKELAVAKDMRAREFAYNTQSLIDALRENIPIETIEDKFRNRPMGDYRQQLLTAYANYYKSQADYNRMESFGDSGAIPAKQILAIEAARNADRASLQACLEQIDFDIKNALLLSSQTIREADTRIAVAETNLKILGYKSEELTSINPSTEGEAISHYPMRAPFDGTVLSKDAALLEHVRLNAQLLTVADLSTLWITADVYQEHLPLLQSLKDKTVRVFSEAWPERIFEAKVFYTGEVMEESSRTIALRASAVNEDGFLKPGMFVKVELPSASMRDALQVPTSAVQEHEGKKFVFVHQNGDAFRRCSVVTGKVELQSVEIIQGISPGDEIVIEGGFILKSRQLADLLGGE